MSVEKEIRNLIDTLNKYTKAYDEGRPLISDREWDDLYFDLQKKEKESGIYFEDSPTQNIIYQVVNGLKKVKHSHPMLSLAKTKNLNEIKTFLGNKKFICMGKMDGLTCALRYVDGVLVAAETRGSSTTNEGEDILHNALVVKNIPKKINYKGVLEVDGEIICTYRDFENFSDRFKGHSRNFAAGSIRLLDSQEASQRKLTFVAWDWINNPYDTLGEALVNLSRLGFTTVPYWDGCETDYDDLEEIVDCVKNFCNELSYPIDGLVFKYDNVKEYLAMGKTAHHFKGGLAFKFYDESVETELLDIEWSMGRYGSLCPVAIFNPVEIDGTKIERASLHNLSVLKETLHGNGWKGQKIVIAKINMIIPQIIAAEDEEGEII